ncbi:hypothetical protein Isop_1246 [Isosphaera pallida ATCC 43644]|uniref:Uncharacterized protein n=1 Tax=Isosphaera pallida (strain ATCC 43644 / DSM 9630 / IS1B) TaxID=575540 RepID=E8R6D1_ISOPI|nr:hypothetical protein Isop_1246 [Isosphaera pallida ATCC 43644]
MLTITQVVPSKVQYENASRRDSFPIDSVGSDPDEVVSKALGLGSDSGGVGEAWASIK